MKTELVRIDNARGIRIPKPIIEQCRLGETVELRVSNDCLIISPEHQPRQGWDDAFRASSDTAHDELMLEITEPDEFDHSGMAAVGGPQLDKVWLAALDPTQGAEIQKTCPCLVVSPDEMNRYLRTVIIAPMTAVTRPYPTRVAVRFQVDDPIGKTLGTDLAENRHRPLVDAISRCAHD
jgi:mRNA-degrading endonuclease toxin of MazEF toxin-antitoxin module/antitoxin component of MazEF toxin-antitoxin module